MSAECNCEAGPDGWHRSDCPYYETVERNYTFVQKNENDEWMITAPPLNMWLAEEHMRSGGKVYWEFCSNEWTFE